MFAFTKRFQDRPLAFAHPTAAAFDSGVAGEPGEDGAMADGEPEEGGGQQCVPRPSGPVLAIDQSLERDEKCAAFQARAIGNDGLRRWRTRGA